MPNGSKLIIGCGYLGLRIAALWLACGHRVYATTRTPTRAAELRRLGIEPVICDVLDPAGLGALPVVATAVHCIGFDRTAGNTMREVYVTGLANVLQSRPPPERFLYVGSTGVYGQTGGEEVSEESPTEPAAESGRVVLEAEGLLRDHCPGAVVLRCSGIYGPGRLLREQAVRAGQPIVGDPEKWLNLVHVEDGAAAVIAAERRARPGGVYNVSDDRPVRRREFYALLAHLLGAPQPRFVLPGPGRPIPDHDRSNRRVLNRRLREELGVSLRYPTYAEGLPVSLR